MKSKGIKKGSSIGLIGLFLIVMFGVFIILLPCIGHTAIPHTINYQGYLTSAAGVPVNGTVQMVFRIYNLESGGTELWSEAHNVTVSQGVYNVVLGASSLLPNPIALPFDQQYYLGVKVGTDSEMTPRIPLTSVGYAFRAKTVEGVGSHTHSGADITTGTVLEPRIDSAIARTSALTAHTSNTSNPHSTTAAQVGAAPSIHTHSGGDITTGTVVEARIDAAIARTSALNAHTSNTNNPHSTTAAQVGAYDKAYVDALEARIAALEAKLTGLTRSGSDIIISGANLHIRSGSGATGGAVNGLGNLIIGYNELRPLPPDNNRTGSHNLILGLRNNYSSFGGIVAGQRNSISGAFSSVSGGLNNTASGQFSSVSGGSGNTASGDYSSVSGGESNTASGVVSSVSGGSGNTASVASSSVSGGANNTAGDSNTQSGLYSSVAGGRYNVASGDYSSVAGGGGNNAVYANKAFGHYSAILGGYNNKAGDQNLNDHAIGQYSTVSGGNWNTASGSYSSVMGGEGNSAGGTESVIIGGYYNNTTSSAGLSTVFGGIYGNATDTYGCTTCWYNLP